MDNIKFSVVIPLYNKEKYIQRTIDSVLNQNIQNFEILVVNDGSTDNSKNIVQQYLDKRIKLINQKNAGEASARNRGIAEATAQYIAFLDADDVWEENFLKTILELIKTYPKAGAYATAYKTKERDGKFHIISYKPLPSYPWKGIIPNYFNCLANNSYPLSSSTTCIKKDILSLAGNFNTSLRIGPDIDMWIRTFMTTKIAFSSEICAIYYRDAENRSVDISNFNQKELELVKQLQRYMMDTRMTQEYLFSFKKYLSSKIYAIILRNIVNEQKKEAASIMVDNWSLLDFKQKNYLILRFLAPKQLIDIASRFIKNN